MAKFHTIFVAVGGKAYACGYGEGGRLGNGHQDVCLEPTEVSFGSEVAIVNVAAAVNHSLFVTDNMQLYSCGLNKYHVLGITSNGDRELTPVKVQGALRSVKIVGCAAAKLHSVVWTDNQAVYTFGTNAGQLGHSKTDLYIKKPRQVSGIYYEGDEIASVHACDSATVVATRQGNVFLLQNYVCRKIISKQLDIEKVQVGGGKLDTSALAQVDQRLHATHSQLKDDSVRVLLRKKSGDLLVWSKCHGTLDRCRFSLRQIFLIKDFALCSHGHTALLITNTGQAFMAKFGRWKPPKPPKRRSASSLNRGYDSCLDMLDADAVQELVLEQVSGVFRAHSGTISPKGKSGALLQCEPCNFITDVPMVRNSCMKQNMKSLLDETHENDGICDIVLVATDAKGNKLLSVPCHMYILSVKSAKLRKMIQEKANDDEDPCKSPQTLFFEECDPVVLKNVVQYLYYDDCDLLQGGYKPPRLTAGTHRGDFNMSWGDCNPYQPSMLVELDRKSSAFLVYQNLTESTKKKSSKQFSPKNVLSQFKSLAKFLGLNKSYFDQFSLQDGVVTKKDCSSHYEATRGHDMYDRHKLRELCDIRLECTDNIVLDAHKCILAARVAFFHSMLFSQWAETESSVSKVPIQSKVFNHVLDFIYKDDTSVLDHVTSVEMLCDIMAAADQMLLERLKDVAEVQVSTMLTLKNVSAIIEFSTAFNCEQLLNTCKQFVCQNLPSLMTTPSFYSIDYKALEECEEFYRSNIESVFNRIITPSTEAPYLPDVELDPDEDPLSPTQEPSSPTSVLPGFGGSPQKKKGPTGRKRSVSSKGKSITKTYGVTLSELLSRKDDNVDSLLHRITATVDVTHWEQKMSDKPIDSSGTERIQNPKLKVTPTESKPPLQPKPNRETSLNNQNISVVTPPKNHDKPSFRDIMASQARKPPHKLTKSVPIQGNALSRPGVVVHQQLPVAPTVTAKPKKMSQKQRKKLELENRQKNENAIMPNAWGVKARPTAPHPSFWDVMKEQSSATPYVAQSVAPHKKTFAKR